MKILLIALLLLTSAFVQGQNCNPVANAGSDQTITLPVNQVTLSGTGTAFVGTIASYAWIKMSGPSYGEMTGQNSAVNTVTWLSAGTYVFRLTVTDTNGGTGSDEVTVIVNPAIVVPPPPPPPPPPTCVAKLYPNPVVNILNIDISCFNHEGKIQFGLYDANMRRLSWIRSLQYDMSRFRPGTYYVVIFNTTYTIIKQ